MATEMSEVFEPKTVDSGQENESDCRRSEIDTSAPFESVKEAATRFGGMGFWKPISHKPFENASEEEDEEMVDIYKVEEHAAQLEQDLITKERETFDVLKELETTKNIVEELKVKLQKEASEINAAAVKENPQNNNENGNDGFDLRPSAAPGFILLELKQAKLNLTRTTSDLAEIRATVDLYNKKIEKERMSLEKTRIRLSSNTSKVSVLEKEINQTRHNLELAKGTEHDPLNITKELQKLSSETEEFKRIGEAAKAKVLRAMSEIEQTKTKIKTAEMRLIAAKKMKQAARASEAVALAEIKALSNTERKSEGVTLTYEEYSLLTSKAKEAEESSKGRVVNAMIEVDEANVSKTEILKKVEEATEEVKITKRSLEEALCRVELANRDKLEVEEALRKWRSEHGQKRRSIQNSTKFKNSKSLLVDVNGLDLVNDELKPVLKPTLSIGQILSRKLLLTEEYEGVGKSKVSLGQMLSTKPNVDAQCFMKCGKENKELPPPPVRRKKFGFARIPLLVAKQSKKKKKKQNASPST